MLSPASPRKLVRNRKLPLLWVPLLITASACDCGVKTQEASGGIKLVQPPGDVHEFTRSIDFGVVHVSAVESKPIQLLNDSRISIAITSMALTSDSSKNFFLKLPSGPLPTLSPTQNFNAEIRYQPNQIGSDKGTIIITTASPITPKYTINLTGQGGASKIDVCSTDDSGNPVCAVEQPNGKLTINMGKVAPPGSAMKPLIVKSEGTLPLNLMSVETTSTTPLDYSLQAGPFPTNIPAGKNSTYGVTFKPTLGGEEDGAIEFDSDDPANPRLLVYLNAVGDAPRLCVSPTTVQFGDVSLGTTATQPLTITSCGAEPIELPQMLGNAANVSITDNGSGSASGSPALFAEPAPPTLPQTLPVGQSIMVNFTFTPIAYGSANGKVVVGSADGEKGIVALQGRGVGCSLVAVPSPMNFGQVPTNSHVSQTVNISNTGTGSCSISSFAIQGGQTSPFAVSNPPATPVSLTPGQSTQVTVTFAPLATPAISDNLVVTANTAMPLLVPLKGTGITPPPCELVPDPGSLVFANVQAGQSSSQYVTVTNVGSAPCYITNVTVNPAMGSSSASDYTASLNGAASMGPQGLAPFEVDPTKTGQIKVVFAPTSTMQEDGDLVVDYDQNPTPEFPPLLLSPYHLHIPVSGGEVPPKICVSPTSLDFGTVPVGQKPTKSFTITSCGMGTLLLRGLKMGPGSSHAFSLTGQVTVPQYLPSGATLDVTVQYAPTTTTGDFGTVALLSNDPNTPRLGVPVKGNASNVCATQLSCSTTNLVFPSLALGDTAPLSLTCMNVGTQPVTVDGVTFNNGNAAFSSPMISPQTVAPGDSIRIEIDYSPQQAGTDMDTVTIKANSCNTVTVDLTGAGIIPSYPPCQPPQQFQPQVKWNWTGPGSAQPSSNNVEMSPLVVNLTDDNGDGRIDVNDVPEVVFTSCTLANCCLNCLNVMDFSDADFSGIGMLRAIHGKDGTSYFDITDGSLALAANTQIATADLDGDNLPEIIAVQHSFHKGTGMGGLQGKYVSGVLLVFDHTGKLEFETDQWTGDPNAAEFGSAPAIADLDGDGQPEIVFERSVFRHDGTKWYDMSQSGNWGHGAFPTISDVNNDNKPEIISGNLVYSGDGKLLWTAPGGLAGGPTMVLDIDGDGLPEVILRDTPQSVHVLDGATGRVKAQASWQPPASMSNDPTQSDNGICSAAMSAADLDGDGNPELIIPAGDFIYTWKYTGTTDLTMMWQQPINDYMGQCGASGSAAFDFEGQGKYDVVYHDTQYLYVFRGIDGTVEYQQPRSSNTIFETPVIADIDNDGHVDVIMTNDGGGGTITGTLAGVVALSNTGNNWPSSRRIWSDHAYHVSEITENNLVPAVENWSWKKGNNNSWRAQQPHCQ